MPGGRLLPFHGRGWTARATAILPALALAGIRDVVGAGGSLLQRLVAVVGAVVGDLPTATSFDRHLVLCVLSVVSILRKGLRECTGSYIKAQVLLIKGVWGR